MIELSSIIEKHFRNLVHDDTNLVEAVQCMQVYMDHMNSIHYVLEHGENIYDVPRMGTQCISDMGYWKATRKKLLQELFRAGAIISVNPGERVTVKYEFGGYTVNFEVVGRYSTAPVWINQKEKAEYINVDDVYKYIISRFNTYR